MMKKFDLLFLVIFLVLLNGWFIQKPYITSHDTSLTYEIYYFFYNEFFYHGRLAQWEPFYSFGIPAHYWQIFSLTPSGYLFMVLGKILHIKNVFLTFKLSMLTEQIIFLLGMYLLAVKLFKNRATVLILCIASLNCSYWYDQIDFDFRIYYLMPLVVYYLVRLVEEKRGEFFWISCLLMLAWDMGNGLYFIFLWTPLLFVLLAGFSFNNFQWHRSLFTKSPVNTALIATFGLLSFAIFYQLSTFNHFVNILYRPLGISNSLKLFLSYGDHSETYPSLFTSLLLGIGQNCYIGLLPLLALMWGGWKQRSQYFWAFALCTFLALEISFRGFGAALFYAIPGVSFFRHLAYIYGISKILLLILSGFGFDYFWELKIKNQIIYFFVSFMALAFLADGFGLSCNWLINGLLSHPLQWHWDWGSLAAKITFYMLAFLLLAVSKSGKTQIILIIALSLDVVSFQYSCYQNISATRLISADHRYTLYVHPEEYQLQRNFAPQNQWGKDVEKTFNVGRVYATIFSMAQYESCPSPFRMDFLPKGIEQLQTVRAFEYPGVQQILGCYASKMRLVGKSIDINLADPKSPRWYDTVALENPPAKIGLSDEYTQRFTYPEIKVTHFQADGLTAQIKAPDTGAWLVYADSFYPGWHAQVNGISAPIYKAYYSLKAVYVKGTCTLKLYFDDGAGKILSYIIMFFCLSLMIFFIVLFGRAIGGIF